MPVSCRFGFEVRALPGLDTGAIERRLRDVRRRRAACPRCSAWRRRPPSRFARPTRCRRSRPTPKSEVVALALKLAGQNETYAVSYATEAGLFQDGGAPVHRLRPRRHRPGAHGQRVDRESSELEKCSALPRPAGGLGGGVTPCRCAHHTTRVIPAKAGTHPCQSLVCNGKLGQVPPSRHDGAGFTLPPATRPRAATKFAQTGGMDGMLVNVSGILFGRMHPALCHQSRCCDARWAPKCSRCPACLPGEFGMPYGRLAWRTACSNSKVVRFRSNDVKYRLGRPSNTCKRVSIQRQGLHISSRTYFCSSSTSKWTPMSDTIISRTSHHRTHSLKVWESNTQ